MVVSSGALQQEGPGFESILGPFCVYMFLCGFSPDAMASSHSIKTYIGL